LSLMNRIKEELFTEEMTITGNTSGEVINKKEVFNDDVIRTLENPIYKEGSLAILKGNLAPDGAVIKVSASSSKFFKHSGPAVVFDDYNSLERFVVNEEADITDNHIIVLRNAGPKGGPGMPEWGMLPVTKRLLKKGVKDILRISDARMSGTSYGTCILHVAPESYVGGPLALVRTGDIITLDIDSRLLNVEISKEEMEKRKQDWEKPQPRYERGYGWMFLEHILQANEGCDFDFLETSFGSPVKEPEIH